jgi:trigger factor
MTKVALETVDAVRRRLAVEVPAGDVTAEIDRAYDQLRRKARVPGFRQGHAPRAVLERMFGDQVRADVFGRLVSESYAEALRDQKIDPVSQPEIVTERAEPGAPLRYSATVEVRPSVVATGYAGLAAERPLRPVTQADVDSVIERLRQEQASLVPITERRVAQRGDIATIDYEARIDSKVVGRGERRLVEVGGEPSEGPGAHLEGVEIGAPTTFDIAYPAEHGNRELAGQRVAFRVVLTALALREVPELDDAFAARVAEVETVADLRQRVHEQLVAAAQRDADGSVRAALIARLVTSHDFDVPQAMVERRTDALVEEVLEGLGSRRPPASREDEMRARLRVELGERAREQVKAGLVLEAIAAQEALEVGDEELDARIDRLAEAAGKARERVRALYQDAGARQSLRSRLLQERAIELVLNRAAITDVEQPSGVAGVAGNG